MSDFRNLSLKTIYSWPEKYQRGIFALTAVLTVMLGFWWDISSLRIKLNGERRQEMLLKEEVRAAIRNEHKAEVYVARLPVIRRLLEQWKAQLTHAGDIPEALNTILKIGADSHLYFALFDPGDRITTGLYPILPIKVIVVGNYHQLSDFLSHLASLSRLVKIQQLSLSSENKPEMLGKPLADRANIENLLTASMDINIGIFQEKAFHAVQKPAKPAK